MSLSLERLRQVLAYDPETGRFTRLICHRTDLVGTEPGSVSSADREHGGGYRSMQIDGKKYYAHILAWFYVTGDWPSDQIDHRNMVRDDNRFSNLRCATRAQNNANRAVHSHSRTGLKACIHVAVSIERGSRSTDARSISASSQLQS